MVSLPASAVTLREAMDRFALPTMVAETERLTQERKTHPRIIRIRSEFVHGPKVRPSNEAARRAWNAERALQKNVVAKRQSLISQLQEKALQGYARENPFGAWTPIPPDAWADLELDFRASSVKDRNGKVYTVRIAAIATMGEEALLNNSPKRSEPVVPRAQQAHTPLQEPVEIAFDTNRDELLVSGVCVLRRANYDLPKALYDVTRKEEGVEDACPVRDRPFITTEKLATVLGIEQATVRARVAHIRKKLAEANPERFGSPDQKHLLIESHPSLGYRFHWAVLVIALNRADRIEPQRKSGKSAAHKGDEH